MYYFVLCVATRLFFVCFLLESCDFYWKFVHPLGDRWVKVACVAKALGGSNVFVVVCVSLFS